MNEILVSESKTLKLTNVLSRRIMPEDFANINLIVTQMENFVRSHGAQPIGPLVQHICRQGPQARAADVPAAPGQPDDHPAWTRSTTWTPSCA